MRSGRGRSGDRQKETTSKVASKQCRRNLVFINLHIFLVSLCRIESTKNRQTTEKFFPHEFNFSSSNNKFNRCLYSRQVYPFKSQILLYCKVLHVVSEKIIFAWEEEEKQPPFLCNNHFISNTASNRYDVHV